MAKYNEKALDELIKSDWQRYGFLEGYQLIEFKKGNVVQLKRDITDKDIFTSEDVGAVRYNYTKGSLAFVRNTQLDNDVAITFNANDTWYFTQDDAAEMFEPYKHE